MKSFSAVLLALTIGARAYPTTDVVKKSESSECTADELQKAINAESDARSYLREELSRQYSEKCFISAEANWKYATNITKENEKNKLDASLAYSNFVKNITTKLVERFPPWRCFQDQDILRQFRKITLQGTSVLPEDELKEYNEITNKMATIYSTAKVCSFHDKNKCNLSLEPGTHYT